MVHRRFSSTSSLDILETSASHVKRKLKLSPKRLKGSKSNPPVKCKKVKFHRDLFPPPQGMKYDIPCDKHKPAKISTLNKFEPVTDLRTLLSATQLSDFNDSCFGKFMNMPHFKIQYQLIHNLLLRQLKQPNRNEIWIGIGGMKLKFGLEEFATVTGLLCVGNVDKMRYSKSNNSFVNTYYEGSHSVLRSSIKKSVFAKEWKNDSDAVKFAKLYFLHHFLLTTSSDTLIPKGDLDLIDSEAFDQYPWGKEVFNLTMDSLRQSVKTTSKDNYYRLTGFPYALQVWFYECCPYMNGKYCDQNSGSIPRVLNWTSDYHVRFEEIYATLSLEAKDLQLKKFIPSAKEVEALQLKDLVAQYSTVRICLNEISDDDFVSPVIPSVTGPTPSSVLSKDAISINKLHVQMRKLVASQKSLVADVNNLKSIINEQRSHFDLELSKLRDMLLKQARVDKEDRENSNIDVNHDGFPFDEITREKVSTRIPEAIPDSPKMVDDVETVVSPVVGVEEDYDHGQCLPDDFSPDTMEKLESVMQNVDAGHLKLKQKEMVVEGEFFVDGVAENVENASQVIREEFAGKPTEVEEMFNSTCLFGPEVEKPEFKINEVIEPDYSLGVAENAEDFVLQVARDIYESNVADEPIDDLETAFETTMVVEMQDAGVVNSEVLVLRTGGGSGPSGLGKATPAVPKRKIRLPANLRSPFMQKFGSSAKESLEPTEMKSLKGICPFDDNLGKLPAMDESVQFYNWLDTGLQINNNKKKFYSAKDNTISPPLNLGCELISEKTWFHTMEYGSSNLSKIHVNVFFYYLRKLSKYSPACRMRFTTTDCDFQKKIASTCGLISEYEDIESKFSANQNVLDVINGYGLAFNTPWQSVDVVLFPIWLPQQKHWLLAVLNLQKRVVRVRNTLTCEGSALIVKKALLPLCMLLPHYLILTEFYSRTDIDFSSACYMQKSKTDVIRLVMKNDYSTGTSIDSGVIMISIAEYFVMEKGFPKDFDIASHRSRLAFLFYSYGIAKHIHQCESEPEYLEHADGYGRGKRTRAGMVQTKKRKMGKASPKSKKEIKG